MCFIHHGGTFVDDELTNYEGTTLEFKCDCDKWSYFGLVGIVKELL